MSSTIMESVARNSTAHLTEVLAITVTLLVGIWFWIRHHYGYWKRRNIPYVQPHPIFGNFKDIMTWRKNPCYVFASLYDHKNAKDAPVLGLYLLNKPCLLIRDLELAKSIMVRNFNSFSNRYASSDPHVDPLGGHSLFFVKNPEWKKIRVQISPVFTSGKMKKLFPMVEEIGRELDNYLCSLPVDPKTNSIMKEVKEINALYSTDAIAIAAYGVRANSLRNPDAEFRKNGKRIFTYTRSRAFQLNTLFFLPRIARLFKLKFFSAETTIFLRKTLNYVLNERMKSGVVRNDLIDLLVKFRREAEEPSDDGKKDFILKGDELIPQAAIFFSAGSETSSLLLSFALFELSRAPAIQKRLREEIRTMLLANNGIITYELVNGMKYLDGVLLEALRLYPPQTFLDRECTLKEGENSFSLKPYCDFEIPHGMPVYIPTYSFHHDPKYFPNPETYDPDRRAPENRNKNNFSAFMAFGLGPHSCIGSRFAAIQTKIGLINFLRNHYVTPCEKSLPHMRLDPRAIFIQSQDDFYMNLVRDPLV